MPSGKIHNAINLSVFAIIGVGVWVATEQQVIEVTPEQFTQFAIGFLVGTLLMSPDLDLAEGRVNSKHNWGLLGFLWVPYGLMFKHRGWSHTWLVGPITRLLYAFIVGSAIFGLLLLLFPNWIHFSWLGISNWPMFLVMLWPITFGYFLSQWLHLIADGISPDHAYRRIIRRRRTARSKRSTRSRSHSHKRKRLKPKTARARKRLRLKTTQKHSD